MRLTCSRCGSVLAVDLDAAPLDVLQDYGPEEPTVPEGVFVIDPNPVMGWNTLTGLKVAQAPANAVVVQPDALADGSTKGVAGWGCCGYDGNDGPNHACATCGQLVGTAWTDCGAPHEMRFIPTAVVLAD